MGTRISGLIVSFAVMAGSFVATQGLSLQAAHAATPRPGPIRFDEYPVGTPLNTQYQSYGVWFSTLFPAFITTDGAQPGSPVASGTPRFEGPIVITIVDPVTGQPGLADGFKMDLGYINNPNSVEIAYYDAANNKLGAIRANAVGINGIDVPVRGVGRIDIMAVSQEDAGYSLDNLQINTVAPSIAPKRMVSFGDSFTAGEGLLGENGRRYDCGTDMRKDRYYENTTLAVSGIALADLCETTTGKHVDPGSTLDWWQRPKVQYENKCHRHGGAWPVLVRQALNISPADQLFVACSGAVTANIGYVDDSTPSYEQSPSGVAGGELQKKNAIDFRRASATPVDFVTIGVGGNDAGFKPIILECIYGQEGLAHLFSNNRCLDDPEFAPSVLAKINQVVYPRLVTTFQGVKGDFPDATILTYGYPSVVDPNTPACKGFDLGLKTLDANERRWAKEELIPTINQAIADAAAFVGITYMDITSVTAGKEICTAGEYVNGLRSGDDIGGVLGNESFHLNERGHAATAKYFLDHYTDGHGHLTFTNPPANPNLRPASQPITLNVGTVNASANGGCGEACVQPACSPTSCNLGVQLSGFDPNTVLTVTLHSDPVLLGTLRTDAHGQATFDAPVPPGTTGQHTLEVSGTSPTGILQLGSYPLDLTPTILPDQTDLTPLVPARVLDTRSGSATVDGVQAGVGRSGAATVTEVIVAGRGGVPATATAAVLNVTAVSPDGAGYLTVFPCGAQQPLASNVNYVPGQTVPNAVVAKIGIGGKVCVYTQAATDLVIDVNAYVPEAGSPGPLVPARVLDTRSGSATVDGVQAGVGRSGAATVTEVIVAGRGGVPATATAAVLNVTAVSPDGAGYLTVFPCGAQQPLASNVNYVPGQTVPNAVVAKIGIGGKVCVYTQAATDLVIDVNAYVG